MVDSISFGGVQPVDPGFFFGDFLVAEGEIDEAQLSDTLAHLATTNLPVGQVAIRSGCLTDASVKRICDAQRHRDRAFGTLAQELGLLNEFQVSQLLQEQSETNQYLGEALVKRGTLPSDRVAAMMDRYKNREGNERASKFELPRELVVQRIVMPLLRLIPRIALRIVGLQLKTGPARPVTGALPHPRGIAVTVKADAKLRIGIAASPELSARLASTMLAQDPDDLDTGDRRDCLGEFLTLLIRTAKREIGPANSPLNMREIAAIPAPEVLASPAAGFAFELATSGGAGALIIDPR